MRNRRTYRRTLSIGAWYARAQRRGRGFRAASAARWGGRLDEPRSFGELLRAYRVAAGLTQEALAARAELSVRGIADLERGTRRFPYVDTLQRLGRGLELTPLQ